MKLLKTDCVVLVIALCLILFSVYAKQNTDLVPANQIIIPNKTIEHKTIFLNEYDQAKKISKEYNKKLILIFGAEWCPYCKELKKDMDKIREFKKYVVCYIDINQFQFLVQKYQIKNLPTSIIIFDDKEEDRKSGYKYSDYCEWLQK
jgi:thioredoxin-related protein